MRLLLSTLATIFLIGTASSCKRCEVCSVDLITTEVNEDGVEVRESSDYYQYPEVCGTNSDLKAYADLCKVEFEDISDAEYECTCQED
ncbi:MAG: hypothetical protein HN542_10610 [Flavobacteriales bacterium]|jgi:hypothetical protein|nr:hypothetical protein [Flavobacteriales bacterium]NCG29203.1 hypothetical protein [Bacteroidota bacterium]MBT3964311.1 hypothetical protein [Flavobacteriales bacterium]MBT4704012.1 hypothetical protein [Flavobacteriales bacterium]MBT4930292.1 hypothetical protein [Flavobacteriales bacterium]